MFLPLTHLQPLFPFYTSWKHQKTEGFMVFSEGIKWEHSSEIGKGLSDPSGLKVKAGK